MRDARARLTARREQTPKPRTGPAPMRGFCFQREKSMRLYSQKNVDRKALKGARIAILGYGGQGRAHALNLKDSGFDVVVGARKSGDSWKKARREGLEVAEMADAAAGADLVAFLVPDLAQKALYDESEGQPEEARRCSSRTASTSTSSRSSPARTSTSC